jgi:hypothetical protein
MNDPLLEFVSTDNILRTAQQASIPRFNYPASPNVPAPQILPRPMLGPVTPTPVEQPVFQAPYTTGTRITDKELPIFTHLIRQTESSHNYRAKNKHTSASGAYQYVNGTWGNYGGYPEARLAPKHVQDAKFNEDAIRKLRKFNGDPFKMIADHMLPAQANKPHLWSKPSVIMVRGKPVHIPPVADYIQKVIRGSPWEGQFQQYLKAQGAI